MDQSEIEKSTETSDTPTNDEKVQDQTESKERPPVNYGRLTNRVYVGNLAWRTSWQDLKDHMRQCGEVVYADVFVDESGRSKGCGIVEYATRQEAVQAVKTLNDSTIPGSDRMIFVREDREDRFFREPGSEPSHHRPPPSGGNRNGFGSRGYNSGFQGWQSRPHYHNTPIHPPQHQAHSMNTSPASRVGRQVFVSNLSYSTNWRDLKDYFRSAGNVIRADVLLDGHRNSKGQGIVLFETKDQAQRAIETLNNVLFQGRVITVQEDKYVY